MVAEESFSRDFVLDCEAQEQIPFLDGLCKPLGRGHFDVDLLSKELTTIKLLDCTLRIFELLEFHEAGAWEPYTAHKCFRRRR